MYSRVSHLTRIIQGKNALGNIPSMESRVSEFEPRVAFKRRILGTVDSVRRGVPVRY